MFFVFYLCLLLLCFALSLQARPILHDEDGREEALLLALPPKKPLEEMHLQPLQFQQTDPLIDAYNNQFYVAVTSGSVGYFKVMNTGTVPTKMQFWQNCEQIEMIEDAFILTQSPVYAKMIVELIGGLNTVIAPSSDFASWDTFNDDVMWATIALTRGYMITGEESMLTQAEDQFAKVWARGWDSAHGGGMWWDTSNQTKNACINGPTAIAAFLLAMATSNATYASQGIAAFDWLRSRLFQNETGQIADHQNLDGSLDWSSYSYNQGTFVGAATLYAAYYPSVAPQLVADAHLASIFTKTNLTGEVMPLILNSEYPPSQPVSDGAGFKGIATRWIGHFASQFNVTDIKEWLSYNHNVASGNRNENNVVWGHWANSTPSTNISSWECFSFCSLHAFVTLPEPFLIF